MAKKRISEAQARKIVAEAAAGAKPADLAKKYGFSLGTYYNWRTKFGGGKPKKAAVKKAVSKKAKVKKVAAKKAPAKRGRKPGRKAAVKIAPAPNSAAAIKDQILSLQAQIKSIESKIQKLKMAYADAIFS